MFVDDNKLLKYWWVAVTIFFSLTYLISPINDPDFFWHLRTGQWIWEHRAIPTSDPFSFSVGSTVGTREYFILTSYWLSQVFYYFVHSISGWLGFFVIRFIFFFTIVWALVARRNQLTIQYSLLIVCFLVVFIPNYPAERPQFFSFIFYSIILILYEKICYDSNKISETKANICLPIIMLIWGNVHGGVLLGQILCCAFLMECSLQKFNKKISWSNFSKKSTVVTLSLVFSFINPNYANFMEMFNVIASEKYGYFNVFIMEYAPFHIVSRGIWTFWIFPLMAILAIAVLFRDGLQKNIVMIFLIGVISYYALKHVRYMPFLGILVLPYAARALELLNKKIIVSVLLCIFILFSFNSVSASNFKNIKRLQGEGLISNYFPKSAVDYVIQNNIQGRLLNSYDWGGFLIWSFGEDRKVFIDGRTLDVEIFKDYRLLSSILKSEESESNEFVKKYGKDRILHHALNKYGFDYAILPSRIRGESFWLTDALSATGQWRIVFNGGNSVVMVKNK